MLTRMFCYQFFRIIPAVTLLLVFLCCSRLAVAASDRVELLSADINISVSSLRYMRDDSRSISLQQFHQHLQSGSVGTVASLPFNQGLTSGRYLFGFSITSQSAATQTLQLATGASYRPFLSIVLFDPEGHSQTLLSTDHATPFSQRNNGFRHLNSRPFELAGGQSVNLVMEYETIGSSYLPLTLGSASAISQRLNQDATLAAFFYSFCLATLLLFALFGAAMADRIIVQYALLFLLGLLTLASMEGFAFKWLWPEAPLWNHYSPLVLLYLLSCVGALVAWSATTTEAVHVLPRRAMLALALVSALLTPAVLWFDFVRMAELVNLPLVAMFVAHVYTMSSWLTLNRQRNHLALLSAALVALLVTTLTLLSLDSSLLPGIFYIHSTRLIYVLVMLATIALLTTHVRTLQQQHEQALQDALSAAERESQINRELFQAEQKYAHAKQLAHLRREQLASASHDIRQPLVSLRSTIDTLLHNQPESTRQQLLNAFSYLDNLCQHYLQQTHPEYEPENPQPGDDDSDRSDSSLVEPYSIQLILSTAQRMFMQEAADKNIQLHCCASSVMIRTSPMVLMRVYSNLLANALKHTASGRVLLGVRRRHNAVCLQIHDSGPGMSAQKLASLMQAYQKGPDSEGSGLGLAICQQLASQHGLGFDIHSREGHGTVCSIIIPSQP